MPIFTFQGVIEYAEVEVHIASETLEDAKSAADNGGYTWLSVEADGALIRGHKFEVGDEARVWIDTSEPPKQIGDTQCRHCAGQAVRGEHGVCAECAADISIADAAAERIAERLERNQERLVAAAIDSSNALLAKALQRRGPPKALLL